MSRKKKYRGFILIELLVFITLFAYSFGMAFILLSELSGALVPMKAFRQNLRMADTDFQRLLSGQDFSTDLPFERIDLEKGSLYKIWFTKTKTLDLFYAEDDGQ